VRRPAALVLVVVAGLAVALAAPAHGQTASPRTVPVGPVAAGQVAGDLIARAAQDAAGARTAAERAAAETGDAAPMPAALTEDEATSIAKGSPAIQDWIRDHPIERTAAEFDGEARRWTVFFVGRDDDGEEVTEAQAFISDETGDITETRVGPQVAWMMARGYPGAFGRALNEPAIWIFLCLVFLVPLLPLTRPRELLRMRTLDLLVLLSFSLSLIWFNRGEIFTSVPLQYPPLIYLALRMGWIGLARARPAGRPADDVQREGGIRRPFAIGWLPPWVLVTLLCVTMALRLGLNAFNSNVIDVGYAGVIGAHLITQGQTPYGNMPSDCGSCDTYGPVNYLAYVPFEIVQPYTGEWDALPAAHGAASMFDLLCLAGMFVIGWRLSGLRLALTLALAWAAFPFTAYALLTNANDSLVAAALIWGFAVMHHPLGRGVLLGLAVLTKFAPAVLLPLWSRRPFPRPAGRRQLLPFLAGLAIACAAAGWVLLLDGLDGARAFWSRTVGYQLGRDSPFSLWGQYPGLRPLQIAIMVLVALAALALVRWPRYLDLVGVAAFSAALIIGAQLTVAHWFYLYIPWFLPFVLLASVPAWPAPAPRPDDGAGTATGAPPAQPAGVGP
jgi:hypothetical protein